MVYLSRKSCTLYSKKRNIEIRLSGLQGVEPRKTLQIILGGYAPTIVYTGANLEQVEIALTQFVPHSTFFRPT